MTLSIIFSAASLILCAFFFIYFRAYLKRRMGREEIFEEYRDEVNRLIAEIDAATERDSLLVEDRIKSLKTLLETVDRRMAGMIRELDRKKASEGLYTSLGKQAALVKPKNPDKLLSVQLTEENNETAPAVSAEPEKPKSLGERAAELAAQGLSTENIAARLEISISEADLALALNNRRGNR
jgi:hypothetical protein